MWKIGVVTLLAVLGWSASGNDDSCLRPIASAPPGYEHNRFGVGSSDQLREFSAYVVSFDGADDDNGDGKGDTRRVPEWVAYEMRASEDPGSGDRPNPWCHDVPLEKAGLAARDRAYAYSREFRKNHPDWYVRGHMAMKYHAERISNDAAWNTHTTLNAVPQRQSYNGGSWFSLECLTGTWANRYGTVWIVIGPIFDSGEPSSWIGEPDKNEKLVAVPDKLFKVVIRSDNGVKALVFISDNTTEPAVTKPNHTSTLKSVTDVEKATGLTFSKLSPSLKAKVLDKLWPVNKDDFLSGCNSKKMKIK